MEVSGQHHDSVALPRHGIYGAHWIGDWTGFRAGLDILEKRKSLVPNGIRISDCPARSLVVGNSNSICPRIRKWCCIIRWNAVALAALKMVTHMSNCTALHRGRLVFCIFTTMRFWNVTELKLASQERLCCVEVVAAASVGTSWYEKGNADSLSWQSAWATTWFAEQ
jgi:hypothetical protein